MLAGTGHWTTARFVDDARARLAAAAEAATTRREHRRLDRLTRLVKDITVVDKKLRAAGAFTKLFHHGDDGDACKKCNRRVTTLLRRRNRLVDAINAL